MPWLSMLSNTLLALSEIRDDLQDLILTRPADRVRELGIVRAFEGRPLIGVVPLVTVGVIMGNMYVAFSWVYLPAVGITMHSAPSITFHVAFVLAVASYHNAVITDPGRIPDTWRAELDDKSQLACKLFNNCEMQPVERKKTTGSYRYCARERKFKPDRAHYCRKMKRNVLRMDHYCPWLSNCVGFYNHKYFILFLMYTVFSSCFADYQLIHALATCTLPAGKKFMLGQGVVLMSMLSATLTPFFSFHCWLVAKNVTTIEFCENHCKRVDGCYVSRFDKGLLRNIQSIMGNEWYKWPIPMWSPPGDGTRWEALGDARPAGGSKQ